MSTDISGATVETRLGSRSPGRICTIITGRRRGFVEEYPIRDIGAVPPRIRRDIGGNIGAATVVGRDVSQNLDGICLNRWDTCLVVEVGLGARVAWATGWINDDVPRKVLVIRNPEDG